MFRSKKETQVAPLAFRPNCQGASREGKAAAAALVRDSLPLANLTITPGRCYETVPATPPPPAPSCYLLLTALLPSRPYSLLTFVHSSENSRRDMGEHLLGKKGLAEGELTVSQVGEEKFDSFRESE